MKTTHLITAAAILCVAAAQAQITSIQTISSSGGLGPVTTIAPLGNGYSYATVGGPNNGWGSVQVSPGSQLSMGMTPRGGILPIVTPSAPRIEPMAMPVSYPEYISIPRQIKTQTQQEELPKEFWDWSKQQGIFAKGEKVMTSIVDQTFLVWVDTFPVSNPVNFKLKNKSGKIPLAFSQWLKTNNILVPNTDYKETTIAQIYGIWLKKALEASKPKT